METTDTTNPVQPDPVHPQRPVANPQTRDLTHIHYAKLSPEEQKEKMRQLREKRWSKLTPEQRKGQMQKAWNARRPPPKQSAIGPTSFANYVPAFGESLIRYGKVISYLSKVDAASKAEIIRLIASAIFSIASDAMGRADKELKDL